MRVSIFVQARRPNAYPTFIGNDGDDAPSDPALGRKAYPESEVAGRVIGAAGQHECIDAFRHAAAQHTLVIPWDSTAIGEEEHRARQLLAVHLDCAVLAVGV